MKNNKNWIKFKNGYTRLLILSIFSIFAGFSLLLFPGKTSEIVIRGVGLIWIIEGISYIVEIYLKYIKSQR